MLMELEGNAVFKREVIILPQADFQIRVKYIADLKIDTILCGALSHFIHRMLTQRGIKVFPWITGKVENVIQAYISGDLADERFLLRGRHRRRRMRGKKPGCFGRHKNWKNKGF
jgi:predicted Fe-Mo cluster-binding NifX family protein